MFSRESQPKPSFATITGKGDNPSYYIKGVIWKMVGNNLELIVLSNHFHFQKEENPITHSWDEGYIYLHGWWIFMAN